MTFWDFLFGPALTQTPARGGSKHQQHRGCRLVQGGICNGT